MFLSHIYIRLDIFESQNLVGDHYLCQGGGHRNPVKMVNIFTTPIQLLFIFEPRSNGNIFITPPHNIKTAPPPYRQPCPVNESSSPDIWLFMHGLFECLSSGCVAQRGDHAKISCQVIQGWGRTLAGHLKSKPN